MLFGWFRSLFINAFVFNLFLLSPHKNFVTSSLIPSQSICQGHSLLEEDWCPQFFILYLESKVCWLEEDRRACQLLFLSIFELKSLHNNGLVCFHECKSRRLHFLKQKFRLKNISSWCLQQYPDVPKNRRSTNNIDSLPCRKLQEMPFFLILIEVWTQFLP